MSGVIFNAYKLPSHAIFSSIAYNAAMRSLVI